MNLVIETGRLTRDPEVRYKGDLAIARYTLAVNRSRRQEGQPEADFINCVAFGKSGEFAEKYLRKGLKIQIRGRLQTDSYEKDGHRVYTTDVIVDEHEFMESKAQSQPVQDASEGFMPIPDDFKDEELPFA